jgi:formate-nitrite transporter family protein
VSEPKKEKQKGSASPSSSEPDAGTLYSASEMHDHVVEAAEEEMDRPARELIVSSIASGLLIGFSYLGAALLVHHGPHEHRQLLTAAAYPLGFIFVVMAQHQLFTENTLEPVLPALEKRDGESVRRLLRLWAIVLPGNLIGAAIFAVVLANTKVVETELIPALNDLAGETIRGGFVLVFFKAIWAGWLIALMAWLLASTRDSMAQIVLIWLTTAPIAAFGFKHSIAGATEAFYLVANGSASFGTAVFSFEVPALLGNIIGGVVLVAMVNHGQAGSK